ncbi:MAG: T9SS type A sorting domain-containing protein [Melioribacteraceae bacterium]|nr:T9SS type A sorting domain-containing protein [Melioribacteraceae bacterium]
MRKKVLPFIFSLITFTFFVNSFAVEISKIPYLQLAGLHTLTANSDNPNSIKWQIDQITINETDGEYQYSANIQQATGDSAKFLFIKYASKYSYYKIFADDGVSIDSMEVQVFNKGVRQKYFYSNLYEPNKPIIVYLILPPTLSKNSNFVMVMHGTDRNADDYADSWKDFVNKSDYIIAAPEFSDADWPYSRSYNLGNMFTRSNGNGNLNPTYKWTFSVVSNIHTELLNGLELVEKKYDIWGHSAGSQFVHRMMEFLPDKNIRYYISANAGWYTIPDINIEYPYGFKHNILTFTSSDLERMNRTEMIVMRGTTDTVRDSNLRTTLEADAQGLNRYERAGTFFNVGNELSDAEKWQLLDVPNIGHDFRKMAISAQNFLINNPITNVAELFTSAPSTIKLYQNYPNPFNPSTTIKYSIPLNVNRQSSIVKLVVYDILGREVTTLVREEQAPGNYEVKFDATRFISGIYYYRISVGNFAKTMKMILVK